MVSLSSLFLQETMCSFFLPEAIIRRPVNCTTESHRPQMKCTLTRQKVLSTSERITTLTAELNDGNSKIEEMKAEFNRIVSWSKIFDESPMEVKKMICGYIIKKVSVFRDYRVKIEFNINVEQFLNGIDSINECATYELPMAQ